MTRPKVSVVTCSYNRPVFLRAAVESLRAQTDPDWEHLICDDSSTDPQVEHVLRWAEKDLRVRVWRKTKNVDRPASLWNFMLDRARGRYFTVLDDDNLKLPRFVEVMSSVLDRDPDLGFVTCGFQVLDEVGKQEAEHHLNQTTSEATLATLSTCDGGALLYRRELFDRVGYFAEDIRTNEDWDWLRRASYSTKFENLSECFSAYRRHSSNRMHYRHALGHDRDEARVRGRAVVPTLSARIIHPASDRLTKSQLDVVANVKRAMDTVSWMRPGNELVVVALPFQIPVESVQQEINEARQVVFLHVEDPYALEANLARVRTATASGKEVWVSTNDAATVGEYQKVVGDRIIVCPLLGASESVVRDIAPVQERDIDVLFCGYAYPSRRRFLDNLLPHLAGRRVALVGDGWEHRSVYLQLPTQGLVETYAVHARAKTVVCLHRTHGDCSDGPVAPVSLNRGFMEGRLGARIFVDCSRPHHALESGDVVQYDGAADLAEKINQYLDCGNAEAAARFADKCAQLYTYETRVARILNCVRAPRFLAEIP